MPLRRLRSEVAKLMALSSDWMGSDELLNGPALAHSCHCSVLLHANIPVFRQKTKKSIKKHACLRSILHSFVHTWHIC